MYTNEFDFTPGETTDLQTIAVQCVDPFFKAFTILQSSFHRYRPVCAAGFVEKKLSREKYMIMVKWMSSSGGSFQHF